MNLDITMALDDSTGHRNLSWVSSMTLKHKHGLKCWPRSFIGNLLCLVFGSCGSMEETELL